MLLPVIGVWGLGLATRSCNLQKAPLGTDINSWVLRHDGTLYHNNAEVARIPQPPQEGDIIVSFCFLSLFSKNFICSFGLVVIEANSVIP